MAEKTFGTLVMGVMADVYKQDPLLVEADSYNVHLVRRYIIDARKKLRGKRLPYTSLEATFETRAGIVDYVLSTETEKVFTVLDKIHYASTATGVLLPELGVEMSSIDEVKKHRARFSGNSGFVEMAAASRGTGAGSPLVLAISPAPVVSMTIHVFGLYEPQAYDYQIENGRWVYSVDGVKQSEIDDQESVVHTIAGNFLRYEANADLYAGPLDDEKGKRQAKWRALAQEELARLEIEKEAVNNLGGVVGYL